MHYDVVVVGGGHAGCEAAAAAARSGALTALVTMDLTQVGAMSCNPAIGGVGKGHLVREVDVFDGIIAYAADRAAIHYRMLNRSKGSAVRGPRVQADRKRFRAAVQRELGRCERLSLVEGEAVELVIGSSGITGLRLADGHMIHCRAVVLASGTFLRGRMFQGDTREEGGRVGERAANALGEQLAEIAGSLPRMKTGTPPRLDGRTIDWSRLQRQASDAEPWTMSALSQSERLPQLACAITRTTPAAHDLVRESLARSPLRTGAITGRGPRYCPSIEDKIERFAERDSHQIFLEPEGLDDPLIYPNGISTSLPAEVQQHFVNLLPGLERSRIVQPGYAVEYDHVDPRLLDKTLMTRNVAGLFCAGQINGTTGYEEAAAQGLVAGLNAAAHAAGRAPVLFDRKDSYIGVMVDDLTLQGVSEPYRMLTARSERRLHLRADNAVARLGRQALATEALGAERRQLLLDTLDALARGADALDQEARAAICRGEGPEQLLARDPALATYAPWLEQLADDVRYAPYIARHDRELEDQARDARIDLRAIPSFTAVAGLSTEMAERLERARPSSLAEASRIQGITPAALTSLLVAARRAA